MSGQPVIITPEFIGSFITVLEPRDVVIDGKVVKSNYSLTAVFPPSGEQKYLPGKADLTALRKSATAAAIEKFGEAKLKAMLKAGKFRTPFLQDDEACEKYGWPEGSTFIRLSSNQKPGVASCYKGPDGKPLLLSDDEVEEKLYPGARMRASVRAFAYDKAGNRGVSIAVNNIQWLGDDERIDGKQAASNEFEATSEAAEMTPESEGETPVTPISEAPSAKSAKAKGAKAAPVVEETPDISLML